MPWVCYLELLLWANCLIGASEKFARVPLTFDSKISPEFFDESEIFFERKISRRTHVHGVSSDFQNSCQLFSFRKIYFVKCQSSVVRRLIAY